jgi:hypothetical protein
MGRHGSNRKSGAEQSHDKDSLQHHVRLPNLYAGAPRKVPAMATILELEAHA